MGLMLTVSFQVEMSSQIAVITKGQEKAHLKERRILGKTTSCEQKQCD